MSLSNTGIDRFLQQNYYSKTQLNAGQLDSRYYAESEFIATSAGAGDAGKPVKLDGSGLIASSMLSGGTVATHAALTAAHGATGAVVGTTNTQTLTNKTLTSPTITTPTIAQINAAGLGIILNESTYISRGTLANGTLMLNGTTYNSNFNYSTNEDVYLRCGKDAGTMYLNDAGTGNIRMAEGGGNVGIGKSPTTKLDVNGTVTATAGAFTSATVGGVTVVTTTATQTLTNKTLTNPTLTTPTISSISNTGTLTLPTSTDTLVGRATTDTLTNKTLTSPTINTPTIGTSAVIPIVYGSSAAGGDLSLEGTSSTKTGSYIQMQATGGAVVVGGTSTDHRFEIQDQGASNYRFTFNLNVSGVNYFNSYSTAPGTLTAAPLTFVSSALGTTGDSFRIETSKTPASAAASGNAGQIAWDTSFLYICTASNTWRRVAHATW